jgi:hypothetical protein
VLGGVIDAVNCGGFNLSYFGYNVGRQLKVFAASGDQRLSGLYELGGLPADRWFGLRESRGFALPVAVCWTGTGLRIRVESGPLPRDISWIDASHP